MRRNTNTLDEVSSPTRRIVSLLAGAAEEAGSGSSAEEAPVEDAMPAVVTPERPSAVSDADTADAMLSAQEGEKWTLPRVDRDEEPAGVADEVCATPRRSKSVAPRGRCRSKSRDLMKTLARSLSPGHRGLGRSRCHSPSLASRDDRACGDDEEEEEGEAKMMRQRQMDEDSRWLNPVSQQAILLPDTLALSTPPSPSRAVEASPAVAANTKPKSPQRRGRSRSSHRGCPRSSSRESEADSSVDASSRGNVNGTNASIIATTVDDDCLPKVEMAVSTDAEEGVLEDGDGRRLHHPADISPRRKPSRVTATLSPSEVSLSERKSSRVMGTRVPSGFGDETDLDNIRMRASTANAEAETSPTRSLRSMLLCETKGVETVDDGEAGTDYNRYGDSRGDSYAIMDELGVAAGKCRQPVGPPTPPRAKMQDAQANNSAKEPRDKAVKDSDSNNDIGNNNQQDLFSDDYTYTYGSPTAKDAAGKRKGSRAKAEGGIGGAPDLHRVQSDVSSLTMPLDLQTAALGYDRNGDPVGGAAGSCGTISPKLHRAFSAAKREALEERRRRKQRKDTARTGGVRGAPYGNEDGASVVSQMGCDGMAIGYLTGCITRTPPESERRAVGLLPRGDRIEEGEDEDEENEPPAVVRRAEFEFMPGIEAPGVARAKREARRMGKAYVEEEDHAMEALEQSRSRSRSKRRSKSKQPRRALRGGVDGGIAIGDPLLAAAGSRTRSRRALPGTIGVLDLIRDAVCVGPSNATRN
uniref:Uncharacterized protein n=1 Tax=Odontella aurita TaxID=265563 RepID=A0A7S4JJ61_9STRA|mmetsp:Transcript_47292/g.143218  ORF Transcript_47292/g.143218 Transcript_47292/m.143218 type:complete len:753 (+) Transcript_47292:49-2307(+)